MTKLKSRIFDMIKLQLHIINIINNYININYSMLLGWQVIPIIYNYNKKK
mgnify:CR=1 FL=1